MFRNSKNRTSVPISHRSDVLRISHRNPWSGHLGRKRTGKRLLKRFFWHRDVGDLAPSARSTRYPEVIPLLASIIIADALLTVFSHLGFPSEILSDNGTNLTAKLMMEVMELLKIRRIHTSPYHMECSSGSTPH